MRSPSSHLRVQAVWIALMDILCLLLGMIIAVLVRIGTEGFTPYVINFFDGWMAFFASVLLANYMTGNYGIQNTFSRFNLLVSWMFSITFALFVLSLMSYTGLRIPLGRGILVLAVIAYSALSLLLKLVTYQHLFRSDMFLCRVLVIGTGARARDIRPILEGRLILPAHKVLAYLRMTDAGDEDSSRRPSLIDGVATIDADQHALVDVVGSLEADLIVIALEPGEGASKYYAQLRRLRFEGVEVLDARHVVEIYNSRVSLEFIDEAMMMEIGMESALPVVRRIKRIFDVCAALVACVISFPLAIFVALVIKAHDPSSPVLYSQQRVGQFGVLFRMFKFRTMFVGAEDETGAVWATESDSRITPVGSILRRMRLDEIPQLINILRGEMSIVGPRPERPEFIDELEKRIPFYNERANVMPGLTGWAQIRYPYGSSIEDTARKLEYDLYYIKYLSLMLDIQIILSTIRIVLLGKERDV
ncbi:MAG: sugar transferase [Verrucomicrobia bacterium]|nr:sugar transferase [Verrucomicrobiota bacterium]